MRRSISRRRFDLTLGYRYSRIDQHQAETNSGELYNPLDPNASSTTLQSFSEGPSTYLAAARYHVNETSSCMLAPPAAIDPAGVVRYRPERRPGSADFYTSDKLWSYEIGEKFKGWGNRFTVDADAFYIDWDNIQAALPIPGTPFLVNGNSGTAHSRGVELQAALVPLPGVTVGLNGAYTDAIFTQTVPGVVIAGDTLTYVPEVRGFDLRAVHKTH